MVTPLTSPTPPTAHSVLEIKNLIYFPPFSKLKEINSRIAWGPKITRTGHELLPSVALHRLQRKCNFRSWHPLSRGTTLRVVNSPADRRVNLCYYKLIPYLWTKIRNLWKWARVYGTRGNKFSGVPQTDASNVVGINGTGS